MDSFGIRLSELRKKAGLSQEELAMSAFYTVGHNLGETLRSLFP